MMRVRLRSFISRSVMEESHWVFIFLCFVVSEYGISAQVATLCRSNERFLACGGCQATCHDPAPSCIAVCREGCYCESGLVRNEDGNCVLLEECPPFSAGYLQTTEPRTVGNICPENEHYKYCEPCNRTCDNPNPICPAQCSRGCFCMKGFVRRRDGKCVPMNDCPKKEREKQRTRPQMDESKKPQPPVNDTKGEGKPVHTTPLSAVFAETCSPHQTFKRCQECEASCGFFIPVCRKPCHAGCFCNEGYYRSPFGDCVKIEDCPKVSFWAEKTNGNVTMKDSKQVSYKNENSSLAQMPSSFTTTLFNQLSDITSYQNDKANFLSENKKGIIVKHPSLVNDKYKDEKHVQNQIVSPSVSKNSTNEDINVPVNSELENDLKEFFQFHTPMISSSESYKSKKKRNDTYRLTARET